MPALRRGGLATVKVVTAVRGATSRLSSHLLAFDSEGDLFAVVEAHALTARRTAAASVLAAKALGMGGARHLAVLGAGRQARAQVDAFTDAMPIEKITIWARREAAAQEFARYCLAKAKAVQVESSPVDTAHGAEIVTCATASETPLIRGEWIATGAHVDLVGGFRPTMREADDALMARATIVTDTQAALAEAGDLVQPIANGTIDRDQVFLLAELLAGRAPVSPGDITVFKSVGHAAEDLVVAELLLGRLGLIRHPTLPPSVRPYPRFT
jgi:ornithine cyclodeaminase